MFFNPFFRVLLLLLMVVATSCSQKKKSILNRVYHNTTTHYNGYFNARESVKEGVKTIENGFKIDYTTILPIFVYGDDAAARSVYPQMDVAIEKCAKVIDKHAIYIRKKEYNKWIDDAYITVGKANFYKKDYEKALESLDYVTKDFKDKKSRFDARMWMIRTYIEMKIFSAANTSLNVLKKDEEFPKRKLGEYHSIFADYYFKQDNYSRTTVELEKAVKFTKKKKRKTYLAFILAQLYEKTGKMKEATDAYDKVLSLSPTYEMSFYAQINQAMTASKSTGNHSIIKERLAKMLSDDKNEEYYDQIHYALAEIALNENKEKTGIKELLLSAKTSINNDNQKGKAYLRLANIYYDKKEYRPAQQYYDSVITSVQPNFNNYEAVAQRRNDLTNLVKNIIIVEKEDSLQQLATLPKKIVEKKIQKIIDKIIEEEERKKAEEENDQYFNQQQSNSGFGNNNNNSGKGGGWYFYNPMTLGFGETGFAKKWGRRKLEDNWRRKSKTVDAGNFAEQDFVALDDDSTTTTNDLKSIAYYIKNIPYKKSQLVTSNGKIMDALYNLGGIYRTQFKDFPQSIKSYEELLSRFDTSSYKANTAYQLYLMHHTEGNNGGATKYKDLILKEFPDSKYAEVLRDPNYIKKQKEKQMAGELFYEVMYKDFTHKRYQNVITKSIEAQNKFDKKSPIMPKFMYLGGTARGQVNDMDGLEKDYRLLIEKYPATAEADLAKKTLKLMNKEVEEDVIANNTVYKNNLNEVHTFVLVVPSIGVLKGEQVKGTLSAFNKQYYRAKNLKVTAIMLNKNLQLILVKSFKTGKEGIDYDKAFSENKNQLKQINELKLTHFTISKTNFPNFYKDKDLKGYKAFYKKYYH